MRRAPFPTGTALLLLERGFQDKGPDDFQHCENAHDLTAFFFTVGAFHVFRCNGAKQQKNTDGSMTETGQKRAFQGGTVEEHHDQIKGEEGPEHFPECQIFQRTALPFLKLSSLPSADPMMRTAPMRP